MIYLIMFILPMPIDDYQTNEIPVHREWKYRGDRKWEAKIDEDICGIEFSQIAKSWVLSRTRKRAKRVTCYEIAEDSAKRWLRLGPKSVIWN